MVLRRQREPLRAAELPVPELAARAADPDQEIETFELTQANEALSRMRDGHVRRVAVLSISG